MPINRKALVIGIDAYKEQPLYGCVADAKAFAQAIELNSDQSADKNFQVKLLISENDRIHLGLLDKEIRELFQSEAEVAILYFAGHGTIHQGIDQGVLVTEDGRPGAWGIPFWNIMEMANSAYPRIKSTIIILDCCHSGGIGEQGGMNPMARRTELGKGITIMTASRKREVAVERNGHGLFTRLLLTGLDGAASDICGRVTAASLYSHVDQSLSAFEQRPIFKANIQSFVPLKQVKPDIPIRKLRLLTQFFDDEKSYHPLDPQYEGDWDYVISRFPTLTKDEKKQELFKILQTYNRNGLVVPVGCKHMFDAAMESKPCALTKKGKHYWYLVRNKLI